MHRTNLNVFFSALNYYQKQQSNYIQLQALVYSSGTDIRILNTQCHLRTSTTFSCKQLASAYKDINTSLAIIIIIMTIIQVIKMLNVHAGTL